jgi:hypothetical protein
MRFSDAFLLLLGMTSASSQPNGLSFRLLAVGLFLSIIHLTIIGIFTAEEKLADSGMGQGAKRPRTLHLGPVSCVWEGCKRVLTASGWRLQRVGKPYHRRG